MINLLLPDDIGKFVAEYRHRRRVVGALLVGALFLVVTIIAGVLYFAVRSDRLIASGALTAERASVVASEAMELRTAVKETALRSNVLLLGGEEGLGPATLVKQILSHRSNEVVIGHFEYRRINSNEVEIKFAGMAKTRQDLLDFTGRLERGQVFTVIESPVSNLIRERDSPFVIIARLYE